MFAIMITTNVDVLGEIVHAILQEKVVNVVIVIVDFCGITDAKLQIILHNIMDFLI